MTPRIERALYLSEQLSTVMDHLAVATDGVDVVLFLHLLARLEALSPEERPPIVAKALLAREEHALELGSIALATLDMRALLRAGWEALHYPDDADLWLRDVLLVATISPWLNSDQVQETLDRATALIEAHPEVFLEASVLVVDRDDLESPKGLCVAAQHVLEVLRYLPLVVLWDRVEG